jgi:serine/threonine protein kinase
MLSSAQVLGKFTIVRLLGQGGMGEVYEARQADPDRLVALKVLGSHLATSDEARARFRREINALARLDHQNIVRIYTCDQTDTGLLYYTMQLVRGITLARFLRVVTEDLVTVREGPDGASQESTVSEAVPAPRPTAEPTPAEHRSLLAHYHSDRYSWAIEVGLAVARALAHAHGAEILHRDIKPSNLMIDAEGHILVVDFGLTRATEPDRDLSSPGVLRGTPWYMSPEQARGEPVDERSDIFSLGLTLYELAARGQDAYLVSRTDRNAILEQVVAGKIRPLRELVPGIPAPLERVIQRCLEHDRDRRFKSAKDLIAALLACEKSDPRPTPPRWWWLWAVVAIPLLLGVGYLLAPTPRPPVQPVQPGPVIEPLAQVPPIERDPSYPPSLRNLQRNISTALQKIDGEPLWKKRIMGTGSYNPGSREMFITQTKEGGPPTSWMTLFALFDPERRPYEFTVAVDRMKNEKVPGFEMGIFFGYREPDAPFLLVYVDLDADPHRVTLGSALLFDGDGVQGGRQSLSKSFAGREYALDAPLKNQRHTLKLHVVRDLVHLTVDNKTTLELDLGEVRNHPRGAGVDPALYTHGVFGVWVRKGTGIFQNASVVCLE